MMSRMFGGWTGCLPMIVLALSALTSGCHNEISDLDIVFISPAQGQELVQGKSKLLGLGGKERAVWVDPRTADEFKAGHIPGAVNLPYERLSLDHKKLDAYDTVIVYGNDYNDNKADGFSKRLKELGHSNVKTLLGGIHAWRDAGSELETSQ